MQFLQINCRFSSNTPPMSVQPVPQYVPQCIPQCVPQRVLQCTCVPQYCHEWGGLWYIRFRLQLYPHPHSGRSSICWKLHGIFIALFQICWDVVQFLLIKETSPLAGTVWKVSFWDLRQRCRIKHFFIVSGNPLTHFACRAHYETLIIISISSW